MGDSHDVVRARVSYCEHLGKFSPTYPLSVSEIRILRLVTLFLLRSYIDPSVYSTNPSLQDPRWLVVAFRMGGDFGGLRPTPHTWCGASSA